MPQTAPASTAPVSLATAEPLEKINAAEQGGQAFDHRRGRKRKSRTKARTTVGERTVRPTPERLAKGDVVTGASYRSQDIMERLRDRGMLDSDGTTNQEMYDAAVRFESLFRLSGLTSTISAQDLTKAVGGGGDAAARFMPRDERQADLRRQWRQAVALLGYYEAYPLQGCARIVIDVCCYGLSVKEAGAKHCPGGTAEAQGARAMDRLRSGLFTLMMARRHRRAPQVA